jgi:hypothetical protein
VFVLLYVTLFVADFVLMRRYARLDPPEPRGTSGEPSVPVVSYSAVDRAGVARDLEGELPERQQRDDLAYIGTFIAAVALLGAYFYRRGKLESKRWFLWTAVVTMALPNPAIHLIGVMRLPPGAPRVEISVAGLAPSAQGHNGHHRKRSRSPRVRRRINRAANPPGSRRRRRLRRPLRHPFPEARAS